MVEAVRPVKPVQPVGVVVRGGRVVALKVDEGNAEFEAVDRPVPGKCQNHLNFRLIRDINIIKHPFGYS
jgi:hypothetical protein